MVCPVFTPTTSGSRPTSWLRFDTVRRRAPLASVACDMATVRAKKSLRSKTRASAMRSDALE
jgi:hypothetical protein